MITCAVTLPRRAGRTLALRIKGWTFLPLSTPLRLNPLFRQGAAVSLLRRRVTRNASSGMLTALPSPSAFALGLGPD